MRSTLQVLAFSPLTCETLHDSSAQSSRSQFENSRTRDTYTINTSQHSSGARALIWAPNVVGAPPLLCGRERGNESLTWETAEHEWKTQPWFQGSEHGGRNRWMDRVRCEYQRRIGELTASVQRLQQSRARAAGAVPQPKTNILDTKLGKPPILRGDETNWQEWYFKFREYTMCTGDKYPELVTAIEDPAQRPMDTTRWDAEQIQVSQHLHLILVMLTEESPLRIVQAVRDSEQKHCGCCTESTIL